MSETATRNSLGGSSKSRSTNRNTWIGDSKVDKQGEYWSSVLVERKDKRFTLQEFDTVQLEAPDDEQPYVGTVLRMYEANFRKTVDIEWFFLKDEIIEFAPKNHKNQHIEEKEVFLAEGEVEIVDNLLGCIKNPCYIVYLTPQDSLLEANQNAMANARFSELYFCRYTFNESKGMTFPISATWTQNKYILKVWDSIPEPIRAYLLKMPLQCFKSMAGTSGSSKIDVKNEGKTRVVEPKSVTVPAVPSKTPAPTMSNKLPNLTALSSMTKTKAEAKAPAVQSNLKTEPQSTATSAKVVAVPEVTVSDASARVGPSNASVQGSVASAATSTKESRKPSVSAGTKPVAEGTTATANEVDEGVQAVNAIAPEVVRSLDVLDLALQLLSVDIPSSSESDSDSSSDDRSAGKRRGSVSSNRRTSGASTAAKASVEVKKEKTEAEKLQQHWAELTDRKKKQYITQAKAMKEKHAVSTLPVVAVPAKKAASATITSTTVSSNTAAQSTHSESVYAESSDSELSEDEFDDIVMAEYIALEDELRQPGIREDAVAYKLFCYEVQRNESSSASSASESSGDDRRGGRSRMSNPYKTKRAPPTAEELVKKAQDKVAQREARLYKRWTDLSFKKLRLYVKRAQRLMSFHAHQAKHSKGSATSEVDVVAAVPAVKDLSEQDAPYANILAAMDAGCEEFDLAFQWMCIDISLGVKNAGDSAGRGHSANSSTKNSGVMEGHFLRKEWANLTERKRGYYYERVRLFRDTYRPNSVASSAKADSGRGRRSASNAQHAISVNSSRGQKIITNGSAIPMPESTDSDADAPDDADDADEVDSDLDEVVEAEEQVDGSDDSSSSMSSAEEDDGDHNDAGVSESLFHAIKAGLSKYEIALQLADADISDSDDSDRDDLAPKGRNKLSRSSRSSADKERSYQMEMDRIVQKFSNIHQNRKNEFMRRASDLQTKFGPRDAVESFSPGSSARVRAQANVNARDRSITSSENRRGKPEVPRGAPQPRASRSTKSKSESDEEQQRSEAPRRKRRFADAMLIDSFETQPSTRRNSSERSSRFHEVQMKRTLAASMAQGRGQAHSRRRGAPQQGSGGSESSSSSSDEGLPEAESEGEVAVVIPPEPLPPRQLRNRTDRRHSAGVEAEEAVVLPSRTRRSISLPIAASPVKAAAAPGGRLGRGNTVPIVAAAHKPVHALIPAFSLADVADDADAHSLQSEVEQKRTRGRSRRSYGDDYVTEEPPVRRGRGRARTQEPQADAQDEGDAGMSDIEEYATDKFKAESIPRRGRGRPRKEEPPTAVEEDKSESDLQSVSSSAAMEDINRAAAKSARSAPKRRRGRPLRNYERSNIKKQRQDRGFGSDVASVSSDIEQHGADDAYIQNKRRSNSKDNVFLTATSPSHKGSFDKHHQREGEQFQAHVPCWAESYADRDRIKAQAGDGPTWVATAEPGEKPRRHGLSPNVPMLTDAAVVKYLDQAHAIIDDLKAAKLKSYFEERSAGLTPTTPAQASADAENDETGGTAVVVKLPIESTDGSLVLVSREIDESLLNLLFKSDNNASRALKKVPQTVDAQLVLWTSVEQQSVGLAFEKYGMSRRALRNSVPDKKFEEMWDYTLRFLAGSEELEENTTYTNRDGVDLILPAKKSHAFKAASPKRSGGNAASNGSTGNAVLVQEEFIAEEGNKFFERLSRSIDETSFWQLLFMLSSVLKSGEFTSSQLVVKAHFILSMATYNTAQSFQLREKQHLDALSATASAGDTAGTTTSSAESAEDASSITEKTDAPAATASVTVPVTASVHAGASAVVKTEDELARLSVFPTKEAAIQEFNMFLPVLVCQQ